MRKATCSEGRTTTTFDGLAYIAQYRDLMKAFGASSDLGATHYINNGFAEGRATAFNVGPTRARISI
jgi:hypothetical protein